MAYRVVLRKESVFTMIRILTCELMTMKRITVFCSTKEVDEVYIQAARELGKLIGDKGWMLVWGGQDTGLMKTISDSVRDNGGKLVSIVRPVEFRSGPVKKDVDEEIVVNSVSEHKQHLRDDTDAIVVLAGGIGTIDEVTEILELKKHNQYTKPIIIVNTNGFYDGLKMQLEWMKEEGFVPCKLEDLVVFVDEVKEISV